MADGDTRDIGIKGDVETVQNAVRDVLFDAVDYAEGQLSDDRVKALQYYRGEPFGTEEQGRSDFVSRDVHDTIKAFLPSLMRMFFGSTRVVEFLPQGPEDVAQADQATDYVNWIVTKDNEGFTVLHNAVKDALIQRTGAIKYWWEESETVTEEAYSGLDELTLRLLLDDESLELDSDSVVAREGEDGQPVFDFTVRRTEKDGRVRIEAMPPEELIVSRRARSVEDATAIGHRSEKTLSEFLEMGYEREDIEPHLGTSALGTSHERIARSRDGSDPADGDEKVALYTEAWCRVDSDGDDIAELRKYCCIGDQFEILHSEPAVEAQIAILCPDLEPHSVIGSSVADQVMDIQRVKSETLRAMQDSLAQSIRPRTGVVEGQANMDDVLNNECGAAIRMRREGAVQPFVIPFVGKDAFPALEYFDNVKESRTGITDATRGLNSDAMQSSTRMAVEATVQAAQQQLELVARVLAETGLRRLYRGILGLVSRHQQKERLIRLRGEWVPMDPRSWNASMDTEVATALGSGTTQEQLAQLAQIKETQEGIIQQFGPRNPLVSLGQYAQTLSKMAELSGFRDSTQFFARLPADYQPPAPEQTQTPEEMLAEVQREEIRANIEKKAAEVEMEREKNLLADDRDRDKQEADVVLRAMEIEAKNGVAVNLDAILARMSRPRREQGTVTE